MLDSGPPLFDLFLIFLLAALLWFLEKAWSHEEKAPETKPVAEERPRGGRRFLWRCKVDEGSAKLEIWTAQDSTSSRP